MFTKRCSPMHYISICTKQMSLQALYGIVAALTQLFSALNISSCSHLACYVDINKNPQLLKETREQQGGGGDYCSAGTTVGGITTMYCQKCVTTPRLRQVSNCSGAIVIHYMHCCSLATCRQIYKDLHEYFLQTLSGPGPGPPSRVLCRIRVQCKQKEVVREFTK